MEPLIVQGDILLVDRSLTPRDGDVVVAVVDGGFCVKRFHLGNHQAVKNRAIKSKITRFTLKSDNQAEGSDPTFGDEDVMIWGVVSSIIRELHPIGS